MTEDYSEPSEKKIIEFFRHTNGLYSRESLNYYSVEKIFSLILDIADLLDDDYEAQQKAIKK